MILAVTSLDGATILLVIANICAITPPIGGLDGENANAVFHMANGDRFAVQQSMSEIERLLRDDVVQPS